MNPTSPVPLAHLRLLAVSMTPDPSQLPGGQVLQRLTDGFGGWALALSLVGLLVERRRGHWAHTAELPAVLQRPEGRAGVRLRRPADRAGPAIVNFFFSTGQGVH